MRSISLMLVLVCAGHARRVNIQSEADGADELNSLAKLLLASSPSAAFTSLPPVARPAAGNAARTASIPARSHDVSMLEVKVPDKRPKELYPWPNMETKEGVREFAYGFWIGGVGGAVVAFVLLINIDFFN
mmetsp:Transcript_72834/g.133194  ORF Transcript_72834/g.133194 Transcript_72834/m.133194 type:complete len:131 (-) Transcript_72834:86-478(-)